MNIFKRYERFRRNEIPFFENIDFRNQIEEGYEKHTVVYLGLEEVFTTTLYFNPLFNQVYVESTLRYDSLEKLFGSLSGKVIVEDKLLRKAIVLHNNKVEIVVVPEFEKRQFLTKLMGIEIFEISDCIMPINSLYAYEYLFLDKKRPADILLKSFLIGRTINE